MNTTDTTDTDSGYRVEHDSMGEVKVPAYAKWRAQTQRAVENFPVSGQRLERAHIDALARQIEQLQSKGRDVVNLLNIGGVVGICGLSGPTSRPWAGSRRPPPRSTPS